MDVAYLEGFAQAEVVDVDDEAFGDCGVGSAHFQFLHGECEFTTGFHTFGVAFEFDGNFHNDGLFGEYFEKVDVEDVVFNGVELDVFDDSHAFFAVEVEFDGEDVGSIDEFANVVGCYSEVGCDEAFAVADFDDFFTVAELAGEGEFDDFAAVEDNGDEVFVAESFSSFFAESCARFGRELIKVH